MARQRKESRHLANEKLKVAIIGTGYVGLTTGVCLAYLGHRVTCVDNNPHIIARLQAGQAVIHEPGLPEMMRAAGHNISYTAAIETAVPGADVVVIAVGTPSKSNGDADVSAIEAVARQIGDLLTAAESPVIVNKSTVPIGSARRVALVIKAQLAKRGVDCRFSVASNPEFLREAVAIHDTLYPDRIIVGAESSQALNALRQLYTPILEQTFVPPAGVPRPADYGLPAFITTNYASAELIKYASNCFLATKISFINQFAVLSEKVGADIRDVARGIGADKRIGPKFFEAGLGWGGSCFGKDTKAIIHTAAQYGYGMDIIQAAVDVNYRHRLCAIEKLQAVLKVIRGNTIGIMGLAFKANTDDLRDAPAIDIINALIDMGARVKVYDPVAMANFRQQFPETEVEYCQDVLDLARDCDALLLVTDWPEFGAANWQSVGDAMRQKNIIDGRNTLVRESMAEQGFNYLGVGR